MRKILSFGQLIAFTVLLTACNDLDDSTTAANSPPTESSSEQASLVNNAKNPSGTCTAANLSTLQSCVRNSSKYSVIQITADISCASGQCCTDGKALLNLDDRSNLTVSGAGKKITRYGDYDKCSVLSANRATNVRINNLNFDENKEAPPCKLEQMTSDQCPKAFHFQDAKNITLSKVSLSNAKSYAIYVWGVDGFVFDQSSLVNSGILGLYIGHIDYAPSNNIKITNSNFTDNTTNAIAIEGVRGSNPRQNLISGNKFYRNHRRGIWPVEPRFGTGLTGGGQIYLAMGDNLTVENNTIADGFCKECYQHNSALNTAIFGIEIGMRDHPYSFRNLAITNNRIFNNDGHGIYQNESTYLDASTNIQSNTLYNNGGDIHLEDRTSVANNNDLKTQTLDGFENGFSGWGIWNSCNPGSSAVHWCPGPSEAFYKKCAMRMMTKKKSCTGPGSGIYAQGVRRTVGGGQSVYANAWIRSGSSSGQACIVFLNDQNVELSKVCSDFDQEAVWDYHSIDIKGQAPQGTSYIQTRFVVFADDAFVDVDNIRVSVQ